MKATALSAGLLLLSSCGGGGDSSGPSSHQQTIGGTLTGYFGGGLTLVNNGADPLQVAKGATTFTFAESVNRGSTYNVSVGADPFGPRQGCTVANGTGTASANISNVVVTCTTSLFSVVGGVFGLAGSGLTLQLNGGSPLVVPAGAATYAFTSVASGTVYTVTVGAQPSGPAQSCTVTNGTGTVGAAGTNNVQLNCVPTGFTVGGPVTGLTGSVSRCDSTVALPSRSLRVQHSTPSLTTSSRTWIIA